MKIINRKFIIKVQTYLSKTWHDQEWHDFMGQPEAEAVCYAIQELGRGANYEDIATEARKFMEANTGGKS